MVLLCFILNISLNSHSFQRSKICRESAIWISRRVLRIVNTSRGGLIETKALIQGTIQDQCLFASGKVWMQVLCTLKCKTSRFELCSWVEHDMWRTISIRRLEGWHHWWCCDGRGRERSSIFLQDFVTLRIHLSKKQLWMIDVEDSVIYFFFPTTLFVSVGLFQPNRRCL